MTETLFELPPGDGPRPPAGPSPGTVRLTRDPDDRKIAGVCAGLARSTSTDPLLWRVTLVVLVLFGGTGLLLYLLAWLLIPRTGGPESLVERVLRGGPVPSAAAVVLGVLAVVVLLALADDGSAPLALLGLVAVAVLVARERRARATAPGALAPAGTGWGSVPVAAAAAVPVAAVPVTADSWPPPPTPVRRRSERSPLGLLTVSAAALLSGVLWLVREAGVEQVTPVRVLAAALLVVGGGLLVGTWYGRARWLLLPGLALVPVLLAAHALDDSYGYGVGERSWRPTAATTERYTLAAGQAVLDLSALAPGDLEQVRARVGAGELLVHVPTDLPVRLRTDVGEGEVVQLTEDGSTVPGNDLGGTAAGAPTGPVTVLDLSVGLGRIEVRRVAA